MTYLLLVAAAVLLLVVTHFGPRLWPLFQRRRPEPPNPPVASAAGNAGAAGVPPAAPDQPAVQATTTTAKDRAKYGVRKVWRVIQWVIGILIAVVVVGLLLEHNYWPQTIAVAVLMAILLVPAWFGVKKLIKGAGGWIAVLIFLMVAAAAAIVSWDMIARGPAATWATIKNLAHQYEDIMAGAGDDLAPTVDLRNQPQATVPLLPGKAIPVRLAKGPSGRYPCTNKQVVGQRAELQRRLRGFDPDNELVWHNGTMKITQGDTIARVLAEMQAERIPGPTVRIFTTPCRRR